MLRVEISTAGNAVIVIAPPNIAHSLRRLLRVPHADRNRIGDRVFLVNNPDRHAYIPEISEALYRHQNQLRMF